MPEPTQTESIADACNRADYRLVVEALAHCRYRDHKYIATCPQCFSIEKILIDQGMSQEPK